VTVQWNDVTTVAAKKNNVEGGSASIPEPVIDKPGFMHCLGSQHENHFFKGVLHSL
jgi:hypothetical protein